MTQHTEMRKINFHARDNRPTVWYKLAKSLLTQFQDFMVHLFGDKLFATADSHLH